jgi:hypothetical protein
LLHQRDRTISGRTIDEGFRGLRARESNRALAPVYIVLERGFEARGPGRLVLDWNGMTILRDGDDSCSL